MAKRVEVYYPDGRRERKTDMSYRSWLTRTVYAPIAIGVMILGGIFGAFGIVLVYVGAKGDSRIKLFGQSIDTASVGVASIFIGAMTVIVVLRRLFKSTELLSMGKETREPIEHLRVRRQHSEEDSQDRKVAKGASGDI